MTSPLASRWVPPVRERAEKREGGGLGCCARAGGNEWAGSAAAFFFFWTKTKFLLFLFSGFKTGNKTSPKLFGKVCKNTF